MGADQGSRPAKDEEAEHRVPSVWRPVFSDIVRALVRHDYQLANGIESVRPVDNEAAAQIREYIEDYGETLVDLPDETWDSSVAQWIDPHWEVLVDLWTEGEGRSDLVLHAKVHETASGYGFEVSMVYVP